MQITVETIFDFEGWIDRHGAIGLAIGAFLSGTILPVSSELMLIAAVRVGMDGLSALWYASVGNCLAVLLNYGLGRFLYSSVHVRVEQSLVGRKALAWMKSYRYWSLAGSWLPVIGDPLTIVAGLGRVTPLAFIAIVWPLRISRYIAILSLNDLF